MQAILQEAVTAIQSMNVSDMTQLKSISTPTPIVELTCTALMILFGVSKKDCNWARWKKFAANPNELLHMMMVLDKDNIKAETIKTLKTHLSKEPDYCRELVASKSKACEGIAAYVIGMIKYYEAL